MVTLKSAAKLYNSLNGVICIYKPACVDIKKVIHTIKTALVRDLNSLPDRPLEQRVEIVGATNEPLSVKLVTNYADNPLACGPRYIHDDFKCNYATHLGLFSSGILVVGINEGTRLTYQLNIARQTRAFRVHGELGKATDTYFWNGRTVERATYRHVTREKIDRLVAHMQAAHQKTMFEQCGVHIESQSAFELASRGVLRPADNKLPVLYGIKCVHYQPPNFTLEIQSVNEYDKYLWTLVHDLGMHLKTTAHCTGVQCIRHGRFGLDFALLRKHWKLEHFVNNMNQCMKFIEDNQSMLRPESAVLSA